MGLNDCKYIHIHTERTYYFKVVAFIYFFRFKYVQTCLHVQAYYTIYTQPLSVCLEFNSMRR